MIDYSSFLLYEDNVLGIGFGILDNGDFLIKKDYSYTIVKKNATIYLPLLPLLQLNVSLFKSTIEERKLDFYQIVPIDIIIQTAFDKGFFSSLFWKDLTLNWIEILDYKSPEIIKLLQEKSSNDSELPKDFKFKMKKILKRMLSAV